MINTTRRSCYNLLPSHSSPLSILRSHFNPHLAHHSNKILPVTEKRLEKQEKRQKSSPTKAISKFKQEGWRKDRLSERLKGGKKWQIFVKNIPWSKVIYFRPTFFAFFSGSPLRTYRRNVALAASLQRNRFLITPRREFNGSVVLLYAGGKRGDLYDLGSTCSACLPSIMCANIICPL